MLGNVEFGMITDTQPGPSSESKEGLQTAAKLLGVDLKNLIKAMTTKKSVVMKEVMISELTLEQSYMARDALCKDLYGNLFSWIIKKVNTTISVGDQSKTSKNKKTNFIGLLDIFGFEIFQKNGFEQLCINYANEKLQQQFNQHMFAEEQREYTKEGINWSNIKFKDND